MVLMLGLLSCVAPATIDAYLPAFGALGREFGVPQDTVQLTLGVYIVLLCGHAAAAWHAVRLAGRAWC